MKAAIRAWRDGFELNASFQCAPGRTLAIVGPNGAGKSTLIEAVAGLLRCDGPIDVAGERIDHLPVHARRLGVVFQDGLLISTMSVRANVVFGATAGGLGRRAARARAQGLLDNFNIGALADRLPSAISGGQARLVALARALASSPTCLLLDEPFAGLDAPNRALVREQVVAALGGFQGPCIVVAHSAQDVEGFADSVVEIASGRVPRG